MASSLWNMPMTSGRRFTSRMIRSNWFVRQMKRRVGPEGVVW